MNWGKYFQFKKGMCDCFLAKKSLMTALNFTLHVHAFVLIIMEHKSYCLEHTKPLFNEHKILNLENLYFNHMFMEISKILKYSIPCSLKNLFNLCPRNQKFLLMTPKVKLEVSKQNFVFETTKICNKLIGHALEINEPAFLVLLFQDLPEIQI